MRTELKKISHSGNLGFIPPIPDKVKIREKPKMAETINQSFLRKVRTILERDCANAGDSIDKGNFDEDEDKEQV